MLSKRHLTILLAIAAVLCAATAAEACPTCKDGLAGSNNPNGIIAGYFWSILFMMSMPFVVLGGIGGYMYTLVRKAKKRAAESEDVPAESSTREAAQPRMRRWEDVVGNARGTVEPG